MISTLALYEADEQGEANGIVYYFCSAECRSSYQASESIGSTYLDSFDDAEPLDGTICDNCGRLV